MQETLITFPTAKLAKEKGFDELCLFGYKVGEYIYKRKEGHRNSELILPIDSCTAPMQNLLQKWLREKHDIHIVPTINFDAPNELYGYRVYMEDFRMRCVLDKELNISYEEAFEKGLQEALKLLPNKE